MVPVADTVVSAPDLQVEGRGFSPWVCAVHSLEVVACVTVCVTVWMVCVTVWNFKEGECSMAGPYIGAQW